MDTELPGFPGIFGMGKRRDLGFSQRVMGKIFDRVHGERREAHSRSSTGILSRIGAHLYVETLLGLIFPFARNSRLTVRIAVGLQAVDPAHCFHSFPRRFRGRWLIVGGSSVFIIEMIYREMIEFILRAHWLDLLDVRDVYRIRPSSYRYL